MSATLISPPNRTASTSARRPVTRRRRRMRGGERPNWLGALIACLWLAVVMVPIYWIVITSLKSQSNYFATNPLLPSLESNFDQYEFVAKSDFPRYFLNSVIVTVGTVVPTVLLAFMAAYAIVRGNGRFLRWANMLFLSGLAIPLQAVVIPVYLIIIRL